MAGTLSVQKIQGLATSATPTTVEISSGHKLIGAAGSIAAPGQVLQTFVATKTDTFGNTAQSYTDIPNMSITITPSSTSSKILFNWHLACGMNGNIAHGYIMAVRNSTNLLVADDDGGSRTEATNVYNTNQAAAMYICSGVFLDSPNTTSATVYKLQIKSSNGSAIYVNRSGRDNNGAAYDGRATSSMSVLEIAG